MRLRQIEAFNAVMLTGTVSGAARLMALSQPAVSRTLQHAEVQLGFPLFKRERGRLKPTREAEALYPEIQRLYAQLDRVRALAAGLRQDKAAELRVHLIPALAHRVLPLALERMRARGAACDVAVHTHHSSEVVTAVALLEADIGFTFDAPRHANVAELTLATTELQCVVPRKGAPRARSVAWHDLAGRPVIRLDSRDPLGQVVQQAALESGVAFAGGLSVQTYHAALAMAQQGLGWAIVDAVTAASADRDKVRVLSIAPAIRVPVKVMLPAGGTRHRFAAELANCVREALGVVLGAS